MQQGLWSRLFRKTGFEKGKMGYACAMTMILFLVLAVLTVIQFKLNKGGKQDAE